MAASSIRFQHQHLRNSIIIMVLTDCWLIQVLFSIKITNHWHLLSLHSWITDNQALKNQYLSWHRTSYKQDCSQSSSHSRHPRFRRRWNGTMCCHSLQRLCSDRPEAGPDGSRHQKDRRSKAPYPSNAGLWCGYSCQGLIEGNAPKCFASAAYLWNA